MPEPVEGGSRYLPGLDGLRAVAVLAVIGYHLSSSWVPGGLLGVGVFFVLSGYLITDLLLAEHRRHGRISFRRFWARRARRLLPALFVMLFVVLGWVTLLDPGQLPALRSDLPAALLYVSNWWFIFHHVSYFARFGPPSPIGHLWSLAVEEQFYLVWPILVVAGLRFVHRRRARLLLVLALAAASAVEMGVLFVPGGDPTRVYDGTDTRAFALLVGAALAIVWPRERTVGHVEPGARLVLDGIGAAALLGIVSMFWLTNQYEGFLYDGGMVLLSVLTALVVAVTIHPAARLGRALGWRPLRWVGKRSYAIYLWHYPIIVLTTPVDASEDVLRSAAQVGASLLLAGLSWRYVEEPVRHGALSRAADRLRARRSVRSWSAPRLRPVCWLVATAALGNVAVCTIGLAGLVAVPALVPSNEVTSISPHPRPHARRREPRHPKALQAPGRLGLLPPSPFPVAPTTTSTTTTTLPPPAGEGVTAIGDSVMIDAAPYLERLLPGIEIYARIGQQIWQVQAAVPKLRAEGVIGSRVIVELGTNATYPPGSLVALLHSLGDVQRVVLVNTRVPRPWQDSVNATIAAVARSYPHATMVNWFAASAGHPGFFYPDGVHLDPTGAAYYARLLARAVEAPLVVGSADTRPVTLEGGRSLVAGGASGSAGRARPLAVRT